jgi:hypothetical protein
MILYCILTIFSPRKKEREKGEKERRKGEKEGRKEERKGKEW